MLSKINRSSGFSLLEMIIAISIGLILLGTVIFFYAEKRKSIALNLATEQVVNVIHDARIKSTSSYFESDHGVYFDTSTVTIFRGSVYDPDSSTNEVYSLPTNVHISDLDIAGSASTTVFYRPRGITNNAATITISVINDPSASTTLVVGRLGAIDRYGY